MYECDVNAGRYRHHEGDAACEEGNNGWQMSGFPLKVLFAFVTRLQPVAVAVCAARWSYCGLTRIHYSSGWPYVPEIIPVEPEPVIRAEESLLRFARV